ncbi:lipopolysaccharide biosynthesis protein [Neobacillus sp. PS3-12]|uniref:lipopolysaccharide biosynthesis protein n=1 Tax=Neobacillus sp. PS3-12 TaxID=3070677 RepID=UPI0035A8A5DC
MNNKAFTFIKNFSYTLSSNLISLIISTVLVFIVPKLIGVEDYGYWQLYLFYSFYVGFLHFGWNDGIYLRYGGKEYKELNKELFFSQFWMLMLSQIVIGAIIIGISMIFTADANRLFILEMTALCMLIVNVRLMLVYILQSTNRIKEYAQITMMERVIYCVLILLCLLIGIRQFKLLIVTDLIAKFIAFVYAMYCCRDIVFNKISTFTFNVGETAKNINAGIKLMFANIASMLIIGIVRFGIERSWDVSTFGKVSLVMSVSSLMMVFIDAVGIVMFPVLRRTSEDKLPELYTTMRITLMVPLLGLLIVYYPLEVILPAWLPKYSQSLMYMALLFPMCIYEGKMALLINTYLKTLRKEKLMLVFNLASVALSLILTLLFTMVFKSLSLAIVSIVILLAFRSALAEVFLSKFLHVSVFKDTFLELAMTVIFILAGWFVTSWFGLVLYLAAYGLYLLIQRKEIKATLQTVKQLVRR